jgi:hypothetical protein
LKLSKRSSLADVAVATGDALRRAGIRAVLTGGACANLYSGGAYQSSDADFVLAGRCSTSDVDRALSTLGFAREGDRYVHRLISFFVEFPSGHWDWSRLEDPSGVEKSQGRKDTRAIGNRRMPGSARRVLFLE